MMSNTTMPLSFVDDEKVGFDGGDVRMVVVDVVFDDGMEFSL